MIEMLYNKDNMKLGNGILYHFNVLNVSKVLNLLELYVNDDADVKQLFDHAKSLNLVKISVSAVSDAVNWLKANKFTFIKKKLNKQTGVMHYIYEQNIVDIVNKKPIVDIVSVEPITLPITTVDLIGSVTDDNLPSNNISYMWSIVSKPIDSIVSFSNAASAQTTATISSSGTYVLQLSASDGEFVSTKDITIIVNPAVTSSIKAEFTTKANTLF